MPSVGATREISEELPMDLPGVTPTGRPVRKCAGKRHANPDYVNSIEAIQDPMGDLIDYNKQLFSTIGSRQKNKKRKRARSPSPALEPFSPIECKTEADFTPMTVTPCPESPENEPIQLTFNIPLGFQGPLKIEFDPANLMRLAAATTHHAARQATSHRTKRARVAEEVHPLPTIPVTSAAPTSKAMTSWMKKYKKPPAGFLDLPPEIRNDIYRIAFVTKEVIDFGHPKNCPRSAALLATCRQIHEEAASVLYSENRFVFRRMRSSRAQFWVYDAKEIGYFDMRHFLHMIGPTNRSYLRRIHVYLEDATKSHAIHLDSEGRFTHDGNLLACFKMMSKDCFLKTFALTFNGRRHVCTFDVRFMEHLCAIEVDDIVFNPTGAWTGDKCDAKVKEILRAEMIRLEALYEKDRKSTKLEKRIGYYLLEKPW